MVRKLKNKILKTPYLWTGIILFTALLIFSYQQEKEIEAEAQKQIEMMAQNVSTNNISIFTNILTSYIDHLEYIKYTVLSGQHIAQTINFLTKKDSILQRAEACHFTKKISSFHIVPHLSDTSKYLEFIVPVKANEKGSEVIALKIPLHYLHHKIAENKNFSYAYLTLSHNDICIFHPDETKIGLPIEESYQLLPHQAKDKLITEAFSKYLNIPVYRYHKMVELGKEKWFFTANVPGLSFKERMINTRNAFKYTILVAFVAFIFIFIFGMLYWQKEFLKSQQLQEEKINLELKSEQQKQQALTAELEHLKSGLNPHFLFNSLSSLKILVNKNAQQAEKFAVALSNLYRYLLKHEKSELVSLQEELVFTNDYIFLQQIRFKDLINVDIEIDDQLLTKNLPPVSLQLLVENCIKHTKMSRKNPLNIQINASATHITVSNNHNPPEKIHLSGMGLKNLTKRYALLTSQPCYFEVAGNQFIAQIPLL